MEKLRGILGDKTVGIPDVALRTRLREIRADNGGEIGVFFVEEYVSEESWSDPETGFELSEGDEFFELHLSLDAEIVRQDIKDSLVGVAYYLNEYEDVKYVIGTTYRRLAQVLGRFGFTLSQNPAPEDKEYMLDEYPNTPRGEAGKPYEEIMLIFQTREQFLERYLPKSEVQV